MNVWLIVGALCGSLLAISAPVGADSDCETRFGCLKCTLTASCARVKQDAHCTCTATVWPLITCVGLDQCDYTGRPDCPRPTPQGECPSFAAEPPIDHAAVSSDATVSHTEGAAVSVRADEVFYARPTLPKNDAATPSDATDSGSTEE